MDIIKLKKELIKQKNSKIKGGIYHISQVNFSYNSNRIEGSMLSKEETEIIFTTSSLMSKDNKNIKSDDIIETTNHFKLFDYMLDNIDNKLSIDMIIEMNKILKKGTSDESNPKYNIGGFKTLPNTIGVINNIKTTSPKDVENELTKLIDNYNNKENITIEDIIDFHYNFEIIHPFTDGNGRVGRMIMFKECLKNNILPFIILDDDKRYYLRGLNEYKNDKTYLIDTLLHEQDLYENITSELLDFNDYM